MTSISMGDKIAGVSLAIGIIALGSFILLEVSIRIRRIFVSNKPIDWEASSPGDMVRSLLIFITYGKWIKWLRVFLLVVLGVAIIITIIAALVSR